jgi:cytochrome c-type biogenesis protein CcmH/NrfF
VSVRAAAPGLTAVVLGVVLAVVSGAAAPARAGDSQQAVEEALTCQCGCGLTVHACNHLQCPSGEPMKKEIADRLAQGDSKDTILAAFRERYGEKVLSSPTFSGFNWLAWLTPFVAVLTAAGVLTVVLGRRSRAPVPVAPAPAPKPVDPALRARLAKELADMDDES